MLVVRYNAVASLRIGFVGAIYVEPGMESRYVEDGVFGD